MLKEKAGETAGKIWSALNETEGLTAKQIKKATKLVDKDLFLGLGWLLREDKSLLRKQKVNCLSSWFKREIDIYLIKRSVDNI